LCPVREQGSVSVRWTALLAVALPLVAAAPAAAQEGPALVQVDAVRAEPMHQTVPVLGRIVTRQRGPVAARVAGRVESVLVQVGDRVRAGQPLVALDGEQLRIERDLAAAEYDAARAEQATVAARVHLLEGERDRMARLEGSAAFSRAQLTDKDNEIAVAQSEIQGAIARIGQYRAQLELKAQDLEDALIRAPYQGVVSARQVSPGAYVRVGDPVVTLIDDSELEIEADVPTERLAGLQPGAVVGLTLDDGSRHDASVRAVVPEENPMTRTRTVRFAATFGETAKPLAVAQSVTLDLPMGAAREVVTVHKDAVIQQAGGAVVFVIDERAADVRPVQLGEAVGGRFEVVGGLEAGDLVVIRGNERLRPGQEVTWPEAPQADAEPAGARS
jgi:RND family efflux transporter MFP subunit